MNLTLTYQHYVEDKLNAPGLVSQAEYEACHCIRQLGARGDFMLLFIRNECIETYRCHCDEQQDTLAWAIDEMDQHPFSFPEWLGQVCDDSHDTQGWNAMCYFNGQRYEYDAYYDRYLPEMAMTKLTEYMAMIPKRGDLPAFVKGEHTDFNMLMYAMQGRFSRLSVITNHDNGAYQPSYVLPDRLRTALHLSLTRIPLIHCLDRWSAPVVVPLDETTLHSAFWQDKRWIDILPEARQPDARIAGTDVKYISFNAQTDGYRNIFLTARALADGTEKRTRLYGNF